METTKNREALELTEVSFLPSSKKSSHYVKSALIVARHPGAANCLGPVARDLSQRGTKVYFTATQVGEEKLKAQFPKKEKIDRIPQNIDWILMSADTPADFEIKTLQRVRSDNPNVKICIVEDFPGSVRSLIKSLVDIEIQPDLVLTTTRTQAQDYRKSFPVLSETLIIPIGQPGFDHLLKEDTEKMSLATREKLSIPSEAYVITYIGTPAGDFPHVAPEKQFEDFNSVTLEEIYKSFVQIARGHPDKNFFFVNRPHPREIPSLWKHPLLENLKNNPDNLHIVSHTKKEWDDLDLSTRQLCAASNLVTTIMSTVGQETALAGSRSGEIGAAIPLYIALNDYTKSIVERGLLDPRILEVLDTSATPYISQKSKVEERIESYLFDEKSKQKTRQAQQEDFKNEYRFKSEAKRRVFLWMRAIRRYGPILLHFANL